MAGNKTRRRKLKILEKHIEEAVCQILELDGWRCFKMEQNWNERKRKRVGEKGMPDRLFIRYYILSWPNPILIRNADVLWIEFKRPGEVPREDQALWHDVERKRGARVLVIDDVDLFRRWYKASGLMQNVISSMTPEEVSQTLSSTA